MSEPKKIALVGNPNCGKTSLFNILTGLNQKVGNFPGVTIDRKSGSTVLSNGEKATIIDLPGSYSLYPQSEDEQITSRVLNQKENQDFPDLVILVADMTNLKRSLLLCTQVMDLNLPVVLALNMSDLAEKKGIVLHPTVLSKKLGIPVVKISALREKGIDDLKKCLSEAVAIQTQPFFNIPGSFTAAVAEVKEKTGIKENYAAFQALLAPNSYADVDTEIIRTLRETHGIGDEKELLANEFAVRYDRIHGLIEQAGEQATAQIEQADFTSKLDKILLHKVWGYVIFLAILALVFQSIFAWAEGPMDLIDSLFSAVGNGLESALPAHFLTDLLVNGVWAGLGGIVIFIPQIALLFLFIAILEDTGYMSRAVFLMDRIMRPFGFSGKSVIPLIGGMACAVPSIMMARTIPNKYERLITIMVTPLMSCSARIPVYTLLIGLFVPTQMIMGVFNLQGIVMLGMYFLGFAMSLLVAGFMKKLLKYDSNGIFITELPVYRAPRWKNVGITMYSKCKTFVVEAGKVILVISIILWFLASFAPGNRLEEIEIEYAGKIDAASVSEEDQEILRLEMSSAKLKASYAGIIGSAIEPVIRPLGFDWKIGISLITSFAAREVFVGTMATLYSVGEKEGEGERKLFDSLRTNMRQEINPVTGKPVYTTATALALMVFYAFAMQCMSTLAIVKRETNSWKWVGIMLVYMTGLAYVSALFVYQSWNLWG